MRKYPVWNEVLKSYEYAESRFGNNFSEIVNHDLLFDEYVLMENFVLQNCDKWNNEQKAPDNVWITIFNHFLEQGTRLANIEKLTQYAFAIAGTSTENERVFSLVNQIWDDRTSQLNIETLDSLLTIQYNSSMTCLEFFSFIKNNDKILDKVHSKDKYN